VNLDRRFWSNKTVLVTGHTGFKGSWLLMLLEKLGANVYGIALEPESRPNHFKQANMLKLHNLIHLEIDIRNRNTIEIAIQRANPDIIIHLAAQALVREGYVSPYETWETNVMGTISVLEGLRKLKKACAVVVATTDKVYGNNEWCYAYRETDRLGSNDPYSASKSATELAVSCWRNSYYNTNQLCGNTIRIATARSGNVIGGGDWANDRIVPDAIRALTKKRPIRVRNPESIRPWQHVLDPLYGYLLLAERLYQGNHNISASYNFGPESECQKSVKELVETMLKFWPGMWVSSEDPSQPHEARTLLLSITRAKDELGWKPRWGFTEAVEKTIKWYREVESGIDPRLKTMSDINSFLEGK